ncbi:MAG: lytic transglycosylase F, partial [Methylophilaceae bacterium]|nr:lytic transglycosylase F [Methylophilaceae bacterium]
MIAILLACSVFYYLQHKRVPKVEKSKELVVLTHNAPGTYYVNGKGEYSGLEYDLATLFAEDLGPEYRVRFVTANHTSEVIPMLKAGKAHLAAANLSITPLRSKLVKFGTPYLTVQQ